MPVNAEAIGKTYPPFEYEVGKEKIREYAHAVGEDNPIYFDRAAATEAGFRDIAAPPMFAVVYSRGFVRARAVRPGGRHQLRDDGARLAGVRVGRAGLLGRRDQHGHVGEGHLGAGGMGFYVFETVSTNQDGQEVVRGTWTNIVRGVS